MAVEVEITRKDHDAKALRRAASKTDDVAAARRMLALALVLDGKSRREAAESCGMDRQTLRDWVHRYNEEGLAGLCDRPHRGRPSRLTVGQKGEFAAIVERGPDPAVDGVVRWRRVDLSRVIKDRFGVEMAERSVGKLLEALGFRKLSARPAHPQGDAQAREGFKKTSPNWSRPQSRRKPKASRSRSGSKTKRALGNKAR